MAHEVDFNRLAGSARYRLAQLLTNRADPALVHSTAGHRDWVPFKVTVAIIGVLAALVTLVAIPLEFSHDRLGRQQLAYLLAATLFFTLLSLFSLGYRFMWKPPAWHWDVQLVTGASLIQVGRTRVTFASTSELGRPQIVHRYRNGGYMGSSVSFGGVPGALSCSFQNKDAPLEFLDRLSSARAAFERAKRERDVDAVRALDPFWEGAERGSYEAPPGTAPDAPTVTTIPGGMRVAGFFAALLVAVAIAGGFYVVVELALQSGFELAL